MEISEAKRLRELEQENAKLKSLLAEAEPTRLPSRSWLRETGDDPAVATGRGSHQEPPDQ